MRSQTYFGVGNPAWHKLMQLNTPNISNFHRPSFPNIYLSYAKNTNTVNDDDTSNLYPSVSDIFLS